MTYPSNDLTQTYTFATKPNPLSYPVGNEIFISDIGINGSFWKNNGSLFVHDSPILIGSYKTGAIVPSLIVANAATYSQTLTTITVTSVGHNIPATTFDGLSVYLDISSGLATAGWYTNLTRVDANTFTCTSTVSQTTSGGVNTNTSERALPTALATVIGGSLDDSGLIDCRLQAMHFNSANNKIYSLKFGGSVFHTNTVTSTVSDALIAGFRNKTTTSQMATTCPGSAVGLNNSASVLVNTSISTTTDQTITGAIQCAAASEYAAIFAVQTYLMNI